MAGPDSPDPNAVQDTQDLTKARTDLTTATDTLKTSTDNLTDAQRKEREEKLKLIEVEKQATQEFQTHSQTLAPLTALYDSARKAAGNYADKLISIGIGATQGVIAFDKHGQSIQNLKGEYNALGAVAAVAGLKLADGDNMLNNFGKNSSIGNITGQYKEFSSRIGALGGNFKDAGAAMSAIPGLKAIFTTAGVKGADALGTAANKIKEFAASAGRMQESQRAFLDVAAATGQLSSALGATGTDLGNLTNKGTQMKDMFQTITSTSGVSKEAVAKFSLELGKNVPEALATAGRGGKNMNVISDALKVAAAGGRDLDEVVQDLSFAYDNLNKTGSEGIKFVAQISDTSNALGARLKDTRDYLNQVGAAYKLVGDNTAGAARVAEQFVGKMRETGISSKEALGIVAGMTDQISKLSIAQKGFLSSRSGGPGGLQGAFQIDQMLRDPSGKGLEKVTGMLESSLRQQIGGRIVSSKEAASSPEAAAQYFRQTQLVKSGAFGNLTGGDDNKTRILLDALAKGGGAGAAQALKTGDEALKDQLDKGSEIQKEQVNALSIANKTLDQIALSSQISALSSIKNVAGVGNDKLKPLLDGFFKQAESRGTTLGNSVGGIKANRFDKDAFNKELLAGVTETIGAGAAVGSEAFTQVANAVGGGGTKAKAGVGRTVAGEMNKSTGGSKAQMVSRENAKSLATSTAIANGNQQVVQVEVTGEIQGTCIECGRKAEKGTVISAIKNKATSLGGTFE